MNAKISRIACLVLIALGLVLAASAPAQEAASAKNEAADDEKTPSIPDSLLSTLSLRSVGPALTSGRIGDLAVNPKDPSEYYVGVCSGGVWKTVNSGTTFKPVFDSQGSYSIGCVTMDPSNHNVVWVGTGENNSQRSVSFGDGIYRTRDGGKSWDHMGLKESEHIGKIIVHPLYPDTVFVAAQGPLWRSGGDRGLYRTRDGGKTWARVLHVSDDTGINEIVMDPRDPDVLYASAYQRRRRVWTLINGGPESGVYKSEDGGDTWRKINRGLPSGDKGRIGLTISPVDPDVLYAIVEAASGGGLYRTTNRGESWSKRSSYMTSSPQYYNEIFADPVDVDRIYALDTYIHTSTDGGKTMTRMSITGKHVDDHALWIDPSDPKHLRVGSDGGLYETWDRGANWHYKPNLPLTQFYKVAVDNSEPFYFIYGGTQDNNTQGGPSATIRREGILNEDWFITVGGDGFEPAIDPTDPNIVYSQWQYGGLIRFDRRSGEIVDIKPREAPGDDPLRWNWDSALIISPHDPKRLYYCAQRVFRSDDRGDSWRPVSGDLTRQIDRNRLEVMGKIQRVDAVSKNRSTSPYGNIVAMSESPLAEGLIYVGTDDGLIQVTSNGGESWRRIEAFPEVPDRTYVSCLITSRHDVDTVYACFDNHKEGDFAPYVLKSTDRGQSWSSVGGDLPDRNVCYAIAEDHVVADLLFVGTEFGAYATVDGGEAWKKLKGVPTIAVRDLEIQRRENDLVLATFGRSFYVLDDYSPLRHVAAASKEAATILPIKPALRYVRTSRGRGSQGASFYRAKNPPFGATFTWWMQKKISTAKDARKKKEKGDEKYYPSWDELRTEDTEASPYVLLTVRDDAGEVVRRIKESASKGFHRTTWNLRYPSTNPVSKDSTGGSGGPLALPGTYTVQLSKVVAGVETSLTEPVPFEVRPLELATFAAKDKGAVLAFYRDVSRLSRVVRAADRVLSEATDRLDLLKAAVLSTPGADTALLAEHERMRRAAIDMRTVLSGDGTLRKRSAPVPMSLSQRLGVATRGLSRVTSAPTGTWRQAYAQASEQFAELYPRLRKLVEEEMPALEAKLESVGAPWTPGRLPSWPAK